MKEILNSLLNYKNGKMKITITLFGICVVGLFLGIIMACTSSLIFTSVGVALSVISGIWGLISGCGIIDMYDNWIEE